MNDEVTKSSPWDVFINLLAVIALYVSVYSAISLLFQFTNLALPEPADQRTAIREAIRYGVSMLIIFFPVYWWAWSSIEADLAVNPGKRRLWVRTVPIYLTLFLAGMTALEDLAYLFYYLMSGDLTSRLVTKIAAVLIVVGGVLFFYRDALRRESGPLPGATWAFAYASAALAAALVVAGFVIAGPPTRAHRARLDALDQQRIRDLDSIQQKILTYWDDKGELPDSIDQLSKDMVGYSPPRDPASGDSYTYFKTVDASFELCTDFELVGSAPASMSTSRQTDPSFTWRHLEGHWCYKWTIDPALHPPHKKSLRP